jgi:hypothetical protein
MHTCRRWLGKAIDDERERAREREREGGRGREREIIDEVKRAGELMGVWRVWMSHVACLMSHV